MLYSTTYPSEIGQITIICDGNGANIVGLYIDGQSGFGGGSEEVTPKDDIPLLSAAKDWLTRYFAKERPSISELPLAPRGNAFRQCVWQILCSIPYGKLSTYGEIAKEVSLTLGKPKMSAQAIGGAVGHNPISIIIPCHRVIGANNNLTGYNGGLDKKIFLLHHEGIEI